MPIDLVTIERANLEGSRSRNANGLGVAPDLAASSLNAGEGVLGQNVVDVGTGGGGGGVEDVAGETSVLDLGDFVVELVEKETVLDLEQARRVFNSADHVLVGHCRHKGYSG